jgi:hypothetical protein
VALPLILLGIIVCLFPLGVYCLYLAQVNTRPHPLMLPGTWDFVGVVAGLSGFLLFGGPVLALAANSAFRWQLGYASFSKLLAATHDPSGFTYGVLIVYAVLVLGWVALVLQYRRTITAIYNVPTEALDEQLTAVADELQLALRRHGSSFAWSRGTSESALFPTAEATLEVECMPGLYHANLRWTSDNGGVRHDVETALRRRLATIPAPPTNPLVGRLTTLTTCLFLTMSFSLFLLLVYTYFLRGR